MAITPATPSAAGDAWTTPARPGTAPVGAIPAENANVGTSPIYVGGDADAGGRDDVAATVAGAVANAQARYLEHEGDTHGQGSQIGDLMNLPQPAAGPGVGLADVDLPVDGIGY
jgi:hypothetical protein